MKSPAPVPTMLIKGTLALPTKDRAPMFGIDFNSEFEAYILISQVAGGGGSGGDASTELCSGCIT